MTGIEKISKERSEQIEKHGFTLAHDLEHEKEGTLAKFAAELLGENAGFASPWGYCDDVPAHLETLAEKVMQKPWIDRLTIAGAMIAAEIDRLSFISTSPEFLKYREAVLAHVEGVRGMEIHARHEDAILSMFDCGMSVGWCINELLDLDLDEAHQMEYD